MTVLAALAAGESRAAEGLVAEYADGVRSVAAVVATPSFSLLDGETIHPAIKPTFAATWQGSLRILVAGAYRFEPAPATMTLDGKPVGAAPRDLKAGLHPVRIEYRRTTGPARLAVAWQAPAGPLEPVPPSAWQHADAPPAVAAWAAVDRGRALVDDLGCRGCHGTAPLAKNARGRGPDLSDLGARTTAAWITKWLENPIAYRTAAKMPHMPLGETERRDLSAFLASVRLKVYGDSIAVGEPKLDDAGRAAAAATGKDLFDKVGCLACHGQGAGMIAAPAIGSKMSFSALRSYLIQPERVDPTGRMPNMALKPDEATALAAFLATRRRPEFEGAPLGGDEKRGRELFAARGCVGCHELAIDGRTMTNALQASPLTAGAARARRGCLAAAPAGHLPRFRLTDAQRAEVAAALAVPDVAHSPAAELRRAVDFYRCRACHEMGGPAQVVFGEKPPSLEDSGNKLAASWIRAVLGERMRSRGWMDVKMPNFPLAARLAADGFADLAGAPRSDPPPPAKPDAFAVHDGVRALGKGEGGLACVNCHDYGSWRAGSATPAPDIATMGRRIRPDWFRRWMLDPQRIQPGTQMPSYFSDADHGQTQRRIDDILAALSLGKQMPLPDGVTADARAVKLPVGKEPVVFRTFVVGGAPRSIVVGFPGGQAYAFDAGECRLSFAWSGELLDVRPVWMERGGQEAIPLGQRWYTAAEGFPLRIGDPAHEPKPRFRGYALDRGLPVFSYDLGDASVRDRIEPLAGGAGLARTIEVRAKNVSEVWFLPGTTPGAVISSPDAERDAAGRLHARGKPGAVTMKLTISREIPARQATGKP